MVVVGADHRKPTYILQISTAYYVAIYLSPILRFGRKGLKATAL
nr:hypothetical protein LBZUJACN_LBZUJACN_CDS_0052 [Caudoviricetes sp.]CAI9751084.1 hypothetical protein MIHLRAQX_MIHLRAQX_CDS_0052 [Caudoviricetes sp.]